MSFPREMPAPPGLPSADAFPFLFDYTTNPPLAQLPRFRAFTLVFLCREKYNKAPGGSIPRLPRQSAGKERFFHG